MKVITNWLRSYLPDLAVTDRQLADDLTLRGIAVEGVFDLGENGSLLEMDITTNRVDAMNHYGIAREAATIYGLKLARLDATLPAAKPGHGHEVRIEAADVCGRFTARVLRGVNIQPSTDAVAQRFNLLGQKLISNAVDATNYVLLGMGHPTHAFDLDKVSGALIIRRARKGEKLKTLDEIERDLDPEDLIVADEKKPLALAGVMGGWDSRLTEQTKNVLVEAAWFDPVTIRRSSKRHLIHTDASHRFERGADFAAPPTASALVCQLLLASGGYIEGGFTDVIIPEVEARTAKRDSILFAVSEARRILGATEDPAGITAAIAETTLTSLGCKLTSHAHETYRVTLPSWRLDLEREIDLIEEVARVYGYNRFRNTLPAFAGTVVELPWAEQESTVRRTLLALGWTEAISSTFCAASDAALFAPQPNSTVPLGNPLSEEAGVLRPALAPGMVNMLALNLSRDVENAALFEMGTAFSGGTEKVEERPALAIGATGHAFGASPADFYDLKGAVEALLGKFASRSVYFDHLLLPMWLHPGRSARAVLDGATVAYFGQLHPDEAARRKLKQPVYIGEIYLDRLYKHALRQPAVRELSRYQAVRRDFSLLVPNAVRWATIEAGLRELNLAELRSFTPKEILREAESIPAGHYSLLVGAVFQSNDRTLRDEELQSYSERVIATLEATGGRLRAS